MFSPDQVHQIMQAQFAVVELLKVRFPNLAVTETTKLAGDIVKAVLTAVSK